MQTARDAQLPIEMAKLELRNVTKTFGDIIALNPSGTLPQVSVRSPPYQLYIGREMFGVGRVLPGPPIIGPEERKKKVQVRGTTRSREDREVRQIGARWPVGCGEWYGHENVREKEAWKAFSELRT